MNNCNPVARFIFFRCGLLASLCLLFAFSAAAPLRGQTTISFLYSDGSFTILNVPGTVTGINDSGQIVGNNGLTSFIDTNGSIVKIADTSVKAVTEANGINNSGQIVGSLYAVSPPVGDGFLYSSGHFTLIDYPGANDGTGLAAINNQGQMVGAAAFLSSSGVTFQFFLDNHGVFTQIPLPGSPYLPTGLDINNAGQIAGTYYAPSSAIEGFLDSGGVITSIVVPGATATHVNGINDAGQLVGFYCTGSLQCEQNGFLDSNGTFTTIDFPGSVGTQLLGINDAGQIIGTATFAPPPTPELPSVLLFAPGLGLVIWWICRGRFVGSPLLLLPRRLAWHTRVCWEFEQNLSEVLVPRDTAKVKCAPSHRIPGE